MPDQYLINVETRYIASFFRRFYVETRYIASFSGGFCRDAMHRVSTRRFSMETLIRRRDVSRLYVYA
jgi:hypothetical protein